MRYETEMKIFKYLDIAHEPKNEFTGPIELVEDFGISESQAIHIYSCWRTTRIARNKSRVVKIRMLREEIKKLSKLRRDEEKY